MRQLYASAVIDTILTDGCGQKGNQTQIQCGDGTCVPFDMAYMNCMRDCPDGIDELCPPGYATCDGNIEIEVKFECAWKFFSGCLCVLPSEVSAACQDLSSKR